MCREGKQQVRANPIKGLHFNAGELKPAAMQRTGDIAVAYYWMTYSWQDKDGKGDSRTTRVTHTWLKEGNVWRIIGGMSMQESAPRQPQLESKMFF